MTILKFSFSDATSWPPFLRAANPPLLALAGGDPNELQQSERLSKQEHSDALSVFETYFGEKPPELSRFWTFATPCGVIDAWPSRFWPEIDGEACIWRHRNGFTVDGRLQGEPRAANLPDSSSQFSPFVLGGRGDS